MKTMLKLLLTLLISSYSLISNAQYTYVDSESSMVIYGTSNVHDWEETCGNVSGTLRLELEGAEIKKVTALQMNIPVIGIKSGKGGMDENTYKALKAAEYPTISYKIKSFGVTDGKVHLTGVLTIAGVTKEVKFPATYVVEGDRVRFQGAYSLKMTDFGIDPPTAVMGTIKCGDDIKFVFDIVFNK